MFSSIILLIGVATNFSTDVNNNTAWVSVDSRPIRHGKWIQRDSGFIPSDLVLNMLIHAKNENVMSEEGVRRVFQAVDTVKKKSGYDQICSESISKTFDNKENTTCPIHSVARFWNNSLSSYEQALLLANSRLHFNISSNSLVQKVISESEFPDGESVQLGSIVGSSERNGPQGFVTFAKAFLVRIQFPGSTNVMEKRAHVFLKDVVQNILHLNKQWNMENENSFQVEVLAEMSLGDEIDRSIKKNVPLVPLVL